jgi:putative SOS response-associated peptidase YedK
VCGRLTLSTPAEVVARHFGLETAPELPPRYNIAPDQPVATIRTRRSTGRRVLELRRWGLVPRWAREPHGGARLINARAESVAERPAFRDAFRTHRCLVPADGFYEWQARGRIRQPFHVHPPGGGLFAIAGLYARWQRDDAEPIESCTVLTTSANEPMRRLHDRMPVILPPEAWPLWLDPAMTEPEILTPLLRPAPAGAVALRPVGLRVNDPRCDDPGCVQPVPDPALFPELF